jgi:acetyl esterase/lipase
MLEKQVIVRETMIDSSRCVILSPMQGTSRKAVLYLYGGAFLRGPAMHDFRLAAYLAQKTGRDIWFLLYPLFPDHLMHETAAAVLACMKKMVKYYSPGRIAWFGFSSGASLCIYAWMMNRHEGMSIPLPNYMILNSPILRVPCTQEERQEMEKIPDILIPPVFLSEEGLAGLMKEREEERHRYLADPLSYQMSYFPETDLYFGTEEIAWIYLAPFLDQSFREHFTLHVHEGKGLWHCYGADDRTEPGKAAWKEYADLLKKH